MIDPSIIPIVYVISVIFLLLIIFQVIFLLQGAPFVASDDGSTKEIVALAKKYKPKKVLDMGSGDGKLVIALAKAGFDVAGIEINPMLVRKSKKWILKEGLTNITIERGNFWNYDISEYDMIVLYAVKLIMPRLERKLRKELPSGAYVISNYANFPNMQPIQEVKHIKVYKFS